jgi:uncharacterized SAM-binding protein YcdF (DUF218 family)
MLLIVMTSVMEKRKWREALFQKTPDAVVVFTGDKGRISKAFELIQQWPESKLIISGVHGQLSLENIARAQIPNYEKLDDVHSSNKLIQLDLDYEAANTLENVQQTLERVEREQFKTLLVVTSDYHVFRARQIFRKTKLRLKNANQLEVYFEGIESHWSNLTNIKRLIKESFKIMSASIVLVFNS